MIDYIVMAASVYKVSPALLVALCSVESSLLPGAINHDDGGTASYGLCQVKLRTARYINGPTHVTDLLNPEINSLIAAKYLRYQMDRYKGNVDHAVAAYNAGSTKFNKEGKLVNEKYVKKVKRRYRKYKATIGDHLKPILAPPGGIVFAVLPRGHAGDKTQDVVQSPSSVPDRAGSGAEFYSGDREQ